MESYKLGEVREAEKESERERKTVELFIARNSRVDRASAIVYTIKLALFPYFIIFPPSSQFMFLFCFCPIPLFWQ